MNKLVSHADLWFDRQPAIIFIDELDALCPKREGAQNEVEKTSRGLSPDSDGRDRLCKFPLERNVSAQVEVETVNNLLIRD